jgi:hypothetical protein
MGHLGGARDPCASPDNTLFGLALFDVVDA